MHVIKKIKKVFFGKPYFATKDVKSGRNVRFGRNVVFNCKRVRIGDGVEFQDNITINSDVFEIGDYGTIYPHCFFPGPGELRIGHNFWLGNTSIVDSYGGTHIANNVGIGAHSQLWTHIIYGDVMCGNRFHSSRPLIIGDDVWLVGHCLVSPVKIGDRSMAMLGSVITRDMEVDHTYAGVPAEDITEKVGTQFKITPAEERAQYLQKRFTEFAQQFGVRHINEYVTIVTTPGQMSNRSKDVTMFNVADRTYSKCGTQLEYKLMRFLLPKAKFIPIEQPK